MAAIFLYTPPFVIKANRTFPNITGSFVSLIDHKQVCGCGQSGCPSNGTISIAHAFLYYLQ